MRQVLLIAMIYTTRPQRNSLLLLGNVYIPDSNNNVIRKVTASTGIITTIAGKGAWYSYSGDNGPATSAELSKPIGVVIDTSGIPQYIRICLLDRNVTHYSLLGNVYFADSSNHRIRKVTVSTGIITTIVGTGTNSYSGDNGAATSATLSYPWGLALDSSGITYLLHRFRSQRNSLLSSRQRVHR